MSALLSNADRLFKALAQMSFSNESLPHVDERKIVLRHPFKRFPIPAFTFSTCV